MTFAAKSRLLTRLATCILAGAVLCPAAGAQGAPHQPPAPIERRPPPPRPQPQPSQPRPLTPAPVTQRGPNGQHLSTWLDQHSSQTTTQRLQALEREPGFHDLPQATQQRMRNRLTQLDNMQPDQRAKIIAHNEAMERLSPDQRLQVRNSMQQLASLPPTSRRAVSRTFRTIRGLPPAQRLAYLNSPDIRSQFTEEERNTLANLMAVERYLPPPTTNEPPPQ